MDSSSPDQGARQGERVNIDIPRGLYCALAERAAPSGLATEIYIVRLLCQFAYREQTSLNGATLETFSA